MRRASAMVMLRARFFWSGAASVVACVADFLLRMACQVSGGGSADGRNHSTGQARSIRVNDELKNRRLAFQFIVHPSSLGCVEGEALLADVLFVVAAEAGGHDAGAAEVA